MGDWVALTADSSTRSEWLHPFFEQQRHSSPLRRATAIDAMGGSPRHGFLGFCDVWQRSSRNCLGAGNRAPVASWLGRAVPISGAPRGGGVMALFRSRMRSPIAVLGTEASEIRDRPPVAARLPSPMGSAFHAGDYALPKVAGGRLRRHGDRKRFPMRKRRSLSQS